MHECFDLLSLKSSRGPLPAMEGGILSFNPLTHIFLSSPFFFFFASRHLSALQLFFHFVCHCPSFEASVLLCYSSLDKNLFDCKKPGICLSHGTRLTTIFWQETQKMRTQLSFQWLKLNPWHYNLCVLFLSPSYCNTQYSVLYCVLNVCGHIFLIECTWISKVCTRKMCFLPIILKFLFIDTTFSKWLDSNKYFFTKKNDAGRLINFLSWRTSLWLSGIERDG